MILRLLTYRHTSRFSTRLPININLFRNDPNLIKQSMRKRYRDSAIVDQITELDKKMKAHRFQVEQKRKEINNISKQLSKNANEEGKRVLQQRKRQDKQMSDELEKMEKNLYDLVMNVGNLVHKDSPVSNNEEDNPVVDVWGSKSSKKQAYWSILDRLDAVDLKRGQKIAGHRGYFLKGIGVKLSKALINFSLDFLEQHRYVLHETPFMIRGQMMKQCCQLSDLETEMYKIENEDLLLIATSEQSLACMYREEVIEKLPIKMAGFSTCFRKQAGAHGKDNQGIFRVHQFQKAEQFVICSEDKSQEYLKEMLQISKEFYKQLEIPFQVVEIVSGALNDAASRKYDLQAWFPVAQKYRELVSVSNCTEYQSRMLNIKYRNKQSTQHVHMLNGTLCAIQRTLCCLVENYASDRGIVLPQALAKYYGKDLILYVK